MEQGEIIVGWLSGLCDHKVITCGKPCAILSPLPKQRGKPLSNGIKVLVSVFTTKLFTYPNLSARNFPFNFHETDGVFASETTQCRLRRAGGMITSQNHARTSNAGFWTPLDFELSTFSRVPRFSALGIPRIQWHSPNWLRRLDSSLGTWLGWQLYSAMIVQPSLWRQIEVEGAQSLIHRGWARLLWGRWRLWAYALWLTLLVGNVSLWYGMPVSSSRQINYSRQSLNIWWLMSQAG